MPGRPESSEPPLLYCADTGGTFTDCLLYPGDEQRPRRTKVLSSGRWRTRVLGCDRQGCRVVAGPEIPPALFAGGHWWRSGDDGYTGEISSSSRAPGGLLLRGAHLDRLRAGDLLELSTGEEAPVLGLRLLLGLARGDAFPPVIVRLASTRATNALLEGTGAPVVLFTTAGFGDALTIGDQRRGDLFALAPSRPPPLHRAVVEVPERLAANGAVLHPLEPGFRTELAALREKHPGCMAAIAFLHATRNPEHEEQLARWLTEAGWPLVVCSSAVGTLPRWLPRTQTAVVEACLAPVMAAYLDRVQAPLKEVSVHVMTSAGGLARRSRFQAKDSLLSGPAGGVCGAWAVARRAGEREVLAFDMGGTSTDVSRLSSGFEYREELRIGGARVVGPTLHIETVAAGGGSCCGFDGHALFVGPGSAGADPGPACYGAGGPLTLTDVHLLSGRLVPEWFGIPVDPAAARRELEAVARAAGLPASEAAEGFLRIADERMADAIRRVSVREGYDPGGHALLAFGGAGGLHACRLGGLLGIRRILFPLQAGLLSALGLREAVLENFAERSWEAPFNDCEKRAEEAWSELEAEAVAALAEQAGDDFTPVLERRLALRLLGQESYLVLESRADQPCDWREAFARRFQQVFGYDPGDHALELVWIQVRAGTPPQDPPPESFPCRRRREPEDTEGPWPALHLGSVRAGDWWEGPVVCADAFATLVVERGWRCTCGDAGTLRLEQVQKPEPSAGAGGMTPAAATPEVVRRELFARRYSHLVGQMGAQLERTAVSVNVKERHDFSCALLDAEGRLVANAPHIPVHLGALGICVRRVAEVMPLGPGEVVLTNHPAYGGSHLPDLTVISAVWHEGRRIGFVANRAHHAEIGGKRPGSMPADAVCLAEEGVCLPPFRLLAGGQARWDELEERLSGGPWPSRAPADNLADIRAQVAANQLGVHLLKELCQSAGPAECARQMNLLRERAAAAVRATLDRLAVDRHVCTDQLDDGTPLRARWSRDADVWTIDFTGTGPVHSGNLNATPAIVASVLTYVLRLLCGEDLPLNEGLLDPVRLVLPEGLLNPPFQEDPHQCPAVVGGNVETSQRLADLLLRPFQIAGDSQGTMNNLVFGDDRFGFYETLAGGAGATADADGLSGIHTHMTNTAVTDPEAAESRLPARLLRFGFRPGSGGPGGRRGGDGLVREWLFLKPVTFSLLTQRRSSAPRGAARGGDAAAGANTLILPDDTREQLPGIISRSVPAGARLLIETPGGGGYGAGPPSAAADHP
ncbi:MAG: 5-oxoprolinase [Puniceicoccaceae bacterium]|nr:MAG: 5-oxoprolinase [Puniceicoccaceae bacterium]